MAVSVQMPKQGNTVVECLLVEWKVEEGDRVKAGDVLCSIETDKAAFDVESTADGVVLKLLAKAGELVPVLTDIAVIGEAGESVAAAPSASAAPAAAEAAKPAAKPEAPAAPAATASAAQAVQAAVPASEGKPVSPRARNLAEKLGVNPAGLAGTGPGGRITSRDVQAAVDAGAASKASPLARQIMAEAGQVPLAATGIGGTARARDLGAAPVAAAKPATAPAGAAPESVPYKGIRKLIGDRMHQSLMEHAQLTMNASADASGLMALRMIFKERAEAAGLPKITVNDLICWVVAQTLPAFPDVNAIFDKKAQIVHRHSRAHLAFAVDTPRGLMVPVVQDAHLLSLADLARTMATLAEDCRKASINPDLLAGGTFTVSNLGGLGVESFTPVINTPQAAILGVCAIRDVPSPKADGGCEFRPRLGLSLTIDHQVVDGAPGARFLQAVAKGVEDIQALLAMKGAF